MEKVPDFPSERALTAWKNVTILFTSAIGMIITPFSEGKGTRPIGQYVLAGAVYQDL